MPPMLMKHDADPREIIFQKVGDLSCIQVTHNNILLAVYERPAQTQSGIHLPDRYREEDTFQGKAALILAVGPSAFKDSAGWNFSAVPMEVGDWVAIRPSDGWNITVNKVLCRMIPDTGIRAKISGPDVVW